MAKCHKAYKVELNPTSEQIKIIERTMGVCRYVYNLFIGTNQDNYRKSLQSYMSGYDFSKWLNNEYKKANPDKFWIWEVSSKAVKKAIMNADTAYRNFMKGKTGFPKFKLKIEQRKFSRKLSHRKEGATKKCKGSNLDKQRLKLQKAHKKITDKRRDYVNKTVKDIVSVRPKYITIEDLNVSGMMKNRHLSRAISECEFWYFRETLERKCRDYGIELRIVDRFYASSKTCSQCRHIKKDLKLSERVYVCENCGEVLDRDFNAAVNLRECVKYRTAG